MNRWEAGDALTVGKIRWQVIAVMPSGPNPVRLMALNTMTKRTWATTHRNLPRKVAA